MYLAFLQERNHCVVVCTFRKSVINFEIKVDIWKGSLGFYGT